jgi:hypothetical protein
MAPILSFLLSSRSKKKEPRCECLNEAKASHSHKMCTEVPSSVPHFLQVGLLLSPRIYKCLLKVLCPVSRPITTLDCVLLKDNNQALVARLGPEINSQAHLCVLQGPHHNTRCWFSIQYVCNLARHKCKTPWWWHKNVETCSSIYYIYIKRYCGDINCTLIACDKTI